MSKEFSLFQNLVLNKGIVDLDDLHEAIQTGSINDIDFAGAIKSIRNCDDTEKRNILKKSLPAITTSGIFGENRNSNSLETYSGMIQVDIDKVGYKESIKLRKLVSADPYILFAALSPSGTGLKMLVQVDSSPGEHKDACHQVYNYVENSFKVQVDRAISDLSRLMFLTYDPECHYNSDALVFEIEKKKKVSIAGIENSFDLRIDSKIPQDIQDKILDAYRGALTKGCYEEGQRNTFVHLFASMCNGQGVHERLVEAVVLENFDLPHSELRQCVKSAYKRKDQFRSYRQNANNAKAEKWRDEHPFTSTPYIPDNVYDQLPDFIKEVTDKIADKRQRDVFFVSLLIILSASLGETHGMYGADKVYANLYAFILAPAASGKGSMNWAKKIASKFDELLEESNKRDWNLYQNLKEMCEVNPDCNDIGMDEPVEKSFLISGNMSSAGFIEDLDNNKGKGLILETEADTLSSSTEQQWGDASQHLRAAFHHEMISSTRKGKKVKIYSPRLSICLTGTPLQAKRLLGSVENGLFSRIIFYVFIAKPEWVNQFKREFEGLKESIDQLEEHFLKFIDYLDSSHFKFRFTKDQSDQHAEKFAAKMDSLTWEDHEAGALKRLGLVAFRIAMILTALYRYERKGDSKTETCKKKHFDMAMSLVDVFYDHMVSVIALLNNQKSANKKTGFFDALPDEFKTKKAVIIASSLGIAQRSALRYLKKYVDDDRIIKLGHGDYKKNIFQ